MHPGVLEPQLDVLRRVGHLALHHPGVDAAALDPAGDALLPGLAGAVHPVGEHLRAAAGGEVVGGAGDDAADHLVAGEAGVAVDQPLTGAGRDHERRVGDDQVERLAGHRVVEAAGAVVDLDAVEQGVEAGHRERPLVDVGGHDVAGVLTEVQGLDAAAGAEVERPVDRVAHGQLGQRGGGRADPEDVVGTDGDAGAVEAGGEVADHPPAAPVVGVGPQVHPGAHLADAALEHPGHAEPVEQAGEGSLHVGDRHRGLEQEQPGQRGQRRAVPGGPEAGGGLVAEQGLVGGGPEQVGDALVVVARGDEVVAEPVDVGIAEQVHVARA